MVLVTIEEASQQLSHLIEEAIRGEEVVIADQNTAGVRLTPLPRPKVKRQAGSAIGLIHLSEDIETPLDDFKDYM